MSHRVTLLGVPIDPLSSQEVLERLLSLLESESFSHVMTPNSEMLVEASRNPQFRSVLQSTALNLPDSVGLLWAARWTKQHLPERSAGVDMVQELCATLQESHSVFLLGAGEGVAAHAAKVLRERNPHLHITGTFSGSPSDSDADRIINRINETRPHILLVAYGAPEQDLWIAKHAPKLLNIRLAIGVGGTFDFLSGSVKRAPKWMRNAGLEWLWRLLKEPKRIGRIWNAVVVFPLMVLRYGRSAP